MTSVKCFVNWLREAGRGHLAFGWGVFLLYGCLAVTRVSFDMDYAAFGIGAPAAELRWLCMGLGILTAFLEFFYLFSQRKQDFYYSLPVSRGVVFWSRYVHGLFHTIVPLILVMAVCGICQAAVDAQFTPYAASYTVKSILVYAAAVLIFYHIGILCTLICGHIAAAAAACAGILVYFPILLGHICEILSKSYFETYYRNPLLERLDIWLSPERLVSDLAGMEIYDKPSLLQYTPSASSAAAAVLWLFILILLTVFALRGRKTEKTGQIFALTVAEQSVEIMAAFLAGIGGFALVTDIMSASESGRTSMALLSLAAGTAAAVLVHCLAEYLVSAGRKALFRRKWQMLLTAFLSVAAGGAFVLGASAYDSYFPSDASSVGISISGLGMDCSLYTDVRSGDSYATDRQLEQYLLEGEGRTAALGWLKELMIEKEEKESDGVEGQGENAYTRAVVCYHMADGSRHYRSYPVSREELELFSAVYETEEYKQDAYPAVMLTDVGEDRFTWEDGVTGTALQMTGEQKAALLDACREDISALRMKQLEESLPCGYIRMKSSLDGSITDMYVYPFFEETCALLGEYGIDVDKRLADYKLESVQMMRDYDTGGNAAVSGGSYMSFYEEEDELDRLKPALVPEELDVQPLLYPLDHSADIDAAVLDEETNSVFHVGCAQIYG